MNLKRILFATDFSRSSDAALSLASSLAADSGALLDIVHVSEPTPSYYAGYGAYAYTTALGEEIVRQNRERLMRVRPEDPAILYEHHDVRGVPTKEILAFADREDVDLIVVGSHGRTGLYRVLMGSVAEEVVRRAKCPVLAVKQPADPSGEPATSGAAANGA